MSRKFGVGEDKGIILHTISASTFLRQKTASFAFTKLPNPLGFLPEVATFNEAKGNDAQLIYNNKSYKYIVNFKSSTNKYIDNNSNGDTLKLVSIGDKNSVFTDLKNEEIFLIPIEEIPPLKSK